MVDLDVRVRVVSACSKVCVFFSLPTRQQFRLETDTIFFVGDFVIIEHDGHSLLAKVSTKHFQTRIGAFPRDACRVIARAVPIDEEV